MNEANEALSRIALASFDKPSGVLTKTRQVLSRELNFNSMAVLVGGRLGEVSCTLALYVEQSMMRLLTLLASVKRLTLTNKVPCHAQVVCLESGNLLVMWHRLELGTCVQGVSFSFASETQVGG